MLQIVAMMISIKQEQVPLHLVIIIINMEDITTTRRLPLYSNRGRIRLKGIIRRGTCIAILTVKLKALWLRQLATTTGLTVIIPGRT